MEKIHISRGNISNSAKFNSDPDRLDDSFKIVKSFIFSFKEIEKNEFKKWKLKWKIHDTGKRKIVKPL